jgi:hypothetical protein
MSGASKICQLLIRLAEFLKGKNSNQVCMLWFISNNIDLMDFQMTKYPKIICGAGKDNHPGGARCPSHIGNHLFFGVP